MPLTQYNTTSIKNATGNPLVNIFQSVSSQTNYLPGMLINIAFYFIIFLVLKARGYNTWAIFSGLSFVNVIIVILMYALKTVPGWYLVLNIITVPLSLFMLWVVEGG